MINSAILMIERVYENKKSASLRYIGDWHSFLFLLDFYRNKVILGNCPLLMLMKLKDAGRIHRDGGDRYGKCVIDWTRNVNGSGFVESKLPALNGQWRNVQAETLHGRTCGEHSVRKKRHKKGLLQPLLFVSLFDGYKRKREKRWDHRASWRTSSEKKQDAFRA